MEHPKFTCRREGHLPQVTVKNAANIAHTVVTVCNRCGDWVEIKLERTA